VFEGSTSGLTYLQATAVAGSTTLTLPAATDTLVGKATTDTLTNKTLTSPTLTTPVLGTPSSGDLTNCTFPTLNQNTTGNAATADYAETAGEATIAATLATARTIGGVSFDGSANIPQRQITHHSATFTFAVDTKQYIGLLDSDSESTTASNINLPFLAPFSGKLLKIFLRSGNNLTGGDLTLLLEKNALGVAAGRYSSNNCCY
jgi:hypothetical protein